MALLSSIAIDGPDGAAEPDLLGQAVAGLGLAILVLDHDGTVLQSTPAADTLLGYDTGQLTGRSVSAFLPGYDSALLDSHVPAPAPSTTLGAVAGRGRDDQPIDLNVQITAWQNDYAPARHTLVLRAKTDITDHGWPDPAPDDSAVEIRSAFDHATIGKAILDPDGMLLAINPAFCALLGRNRDDLIGAGLDAILHPDDLEATLQDLRRQRGGAWTGQSAERRFLHQSGHEIWGDLSIAAVRDENEEVRQFVVQVVDVTEQRRLQDLKSEFVSSVSHELRTPLTSIQGALKLFNAQTADHDLSAPARRLLQIALQNCDRLALLVGDILDFEKFSRGDLGLEISAQDLRPLIDRAATDIRRIADPHDVTVATRLPDTALTAPVDAERFAQLMDNLLSNAAKFSDRGSEVLVTLTRDNDRARVVVRNTGKGIAEDFRESIFKPFAQAASALTRDHGGTGLGLSICKQIVENLGGDIGYDSTPGGFTEFWFTVPLASTGRNSGQ
ncbi:Alginate biosynthesis sensor protein KinB [Sulfitobacter sp. THAF37]|uniref:PAS domain-containing sensor histidine kinase n=1 Tax=Sulfitobacter sp. THAF37 TaxID=2587855 RepID=UPI001267B112|nr:ATP-binding protein [Sulfitobacter sp. THAF37]QFT59869.1 Alginate biosynthesis sensor protein KinB [Sulfitobacter sp. THAF37]